MLKSKLGFVRNIHSYFLLVALVLAAIATILMRKYFYPYKFTVLEKLSTSDGIITYYYHDFDKDGFSELMEIHNSPGERYFIYIKGYAGGTIDQTNYWEPVNPYNMLFDDLNGDGFDEIITFTQDTDSLFLYVHDLISKKAMINRQFLVNTKAYLSPTGKHVAFFPACIADPRVYNQQVLIFAIRSSSRLPRSVYAFDLKSLRIIKEFQTHAALTNLYTYDLTNDGLDDIIITSAAWGNIHYDAAYKDDRCWLFVLDQKLNPIFPPRSFSEFPAELLCVPLEIHTERYLLAIPDYHGHKNINRMMYIIDKKGKIHSRVQNLFKIPADYQIVVTSNENPSKIYGWLESNQLIKLNHHLELIDRVRFPSGKHIFSYFMDMNNDNHQEIVSLSYKHLTVYDKELNRLGVLDIDRPKSRPIFRSTGIKNPPEIGLHIGDDFYRLDFTQNKLDSFFPLIFVGLTGIIFFLLGGVYRFSMFAALYVQIFKYFLYDSSDGILIVNDRGKILYSNNQFLQILDLPHAPVRGDYFQTVFDQYPQIVEFFQEIQGRNVPAKTNSGEQDAGPNCEIKIHPLRFFIKNNFIYLVELKSRKHLSVSDKIQSWSQAVQKMAHDIKTPLSTVALNLRVLQTRLEKIRLSETEHYELSDDIKMMRTELENIQLMTKNFLKFSNLDRPHFQAFDIKEIIDDAFKKYQPYLSSDLDIHLSIDDDVKPAWADPQQIEMVFHILLENALTAMQGKGLIKVDISMVQYLDKSFTDFLEIEVADTGPGIEDNDKTKIFEPYYTTNKDGTGMGLAIAKKIVEDHGGFIEVHSKQNFGAAFCFSLPAITDELN